MVTKCKCNDNFEIALKSMRSQSHEQRNSLPCSWFEAGEENRIGCERLYWMGCLPILCINLNVPIDTMLDYLTNIDSVNGPFALTAINTELTNFWLKSNYQIKRDTELSPKFVNTWYFLYSSTILSYEDVTVHTRDSRLHNCFKHWWIKGGARDPSPLVQFLLF